VPGGFTARPPFCTKISAIAPSPSAISFTNEAGTRNAL
jgi:hypothetical protein